MFGWIPDIFTEGQRKDEIIAKLRIENANLQQRQAMQAEENASLRRRLSNLEANPPFVAVAKDFEIGPKLYASIVDKFYDKMEPILSDAAFSMLMNVRFHRPRAHHSVAMVDTLSTLRTTAHEFRVPEFNCRIQTVESLPYE